MDFCNSIDEPHFEVKCNLTGLQELYVDFDRWIVQLHKERSCRSSRPRKIEETPNPTKKSKHLSWECTNTCDGNILQDKNRLTKDFFPYQIANEDVNNFVFFDYVLYKLVDQNGRKRLMLKYKKSKL